MPGIAGGISQGLRALIALTQFYVPHPLPPRAVISGITYDATGIPLGGCTVTVLDVTATPDVQVACVISEANGTYAVEVPDYAGKLFQVIAYLPGSPDVAGVTANTIIPSLT